MYTPRANGGMFMLFTMTALGVLIAALVFPSLRHDAYAPLREMVEPPPAPVVISVLYPTEKEAWLNEVVGDFEKTNPMIDGQPIQLKLEKMGSWEINAAVLDGTRQADMVR